mmetsp:Transcript_87652/g.128216  ORF Transcript_87652/g.128216 Transcript_87652/m.128216 type:complete len:215 (-) Transcript_87652:138-782(-)
MAVGVLKVVIDYYQKAISKFVPHYMRDYVHPRGIVIHRRTSDTLSPFSRTNFRARQDTRHQTAVHCRNLTVANFRIITPCKKQRYLLATTLKLPIIKETHTRQSVGHHCRSHMPPCPRLIVCVPEYLTSTFFFMTFKIVRTPLQERKRVFFEMFAHVIAPDFLELLERHFINCIIKAIFLQIIFATPIYFANEQKLLIYCACCCYCMRPEQVLF